MEYMLSHQNLNDLKQQDSYDHYLFKSLNESQSQQQQDYLDYLLKDDHDKNRPQRPQHQVKIDSFVQITIEQLDQLISLRTTSLHQIITYLHQYFTIPKEAEKMLLSKIRSRKMKLKRQYAKMERSMSRRQVEIQIKLGEGEVKIEESTISSLSVDEESQQTRKKKRNRMSAQNSRDRKKQYIRQMQTQNQQLKQRIQFLETQNNFHHNNKDIIKLLLCLGITVMANITHDQNAVILEPISSLQQSPVALNQFQINQSQITKISQFIKQQDGQFLNVAIKKNISKIQRQLSQKINTKTPPPPTPSSFQSKVHQKLPIYPLTTPKCVLQTQIRRQSDQITIRQDRYQQIRSHQQSKCNRFIYQ